MSNKIRGFQVADETIEGSNIKDESVDSNDIKDEGVGRDETNTTTPGQALIEKLLVNLPLTQTQTGVDVGTGDVAVSLFTDFERKTTGLIHQPIGWAEYLTKTFVIPEAGQYFFFWWFQWSINSTGGDFQARISLNDDLNNLIFNMQKEGKDSAGIGIALPNTTGGSTNTGTDQIQGYSGFDVLTLSAGNNKFDLDFGCANASSLEPAIYKGIMAIMRFK